MSTDLQRQFDALPVHVRARITEHARKLTANDYQKLSFDEYLAVLVKHYLSGK